MPDNNGKLSILSPIVQYMFAGLCIILMAFIFWQDRNTESRFDKMLEMQSKTNQVIEQNTTAIDYLTKVVVAQEK